MRNTPIAITKPALACFVLLVWASFFALPAEELAADHRASATQRNGSKDSLDATPRISNVFYETDLQEVLLNISDQAGIPIVADQTVRGYITMAVSDLPLDECLRRILEPLGYTFRKMDDYYLVGSSRPDSPSFHKLSTTEMITPSYLKTSEIVKLMSTYYEPFVRADDKTNRLTITAAPDIVERFKRDLNKLDTPPRQIMIEALVTELSETRLKEFGLETLIEGERGAKSGVLNILTGGISDSTLQIIGTKLGDVQNGWTIDYQTILKALVREGVANIRANPRLATQEGQSAKIFIGKDQYYTIATGRDPYVYTRLEVIKVGISLEITPYVSVDSTITVELKSVVSDVTGMGATGLPVINTRDVSTRIQVRDGESIVIGGLQTEDSRETVKKVPLLGEIPILGFLFRSTSKETRKSDIVILITPHLLRNARDR